MPQPTSIAGLKIQANELADRFYTFHGHISRPEFNFEAATHPQERLMYAMAREAQQALSRVSVGKPRTDWTIVEQTNRLADKFYVMLGHISRPKFKFHDATHPQEVLCWRMAAEAQEMITDTEVDNALAEIQS